MDNSGNLNSPSNIANVLDANRVPKDHVTAGRYISYLHDVVNSWAGHPRLLTLSADGKDLRPAVFQTARKPPALTRIILRTIIIAK